MLFRDLQADRRGRLSLLYGINLAKKNDPNWLPLGTPPLGGGWEGFPSEGVCPYFVALLRHEVDCGWKQREAFLDVKRRLLRIKETPSSY